jgi:hypothetical protein
MTTELERKLCYDPAFRWKMLYSEAERKGKVRELDFQGHSLIFAAISEEDEYSPVLGPHIRYKRANALRNNGRSLVFIDGLPEFMVNQFALHEHFEERFTFGIGHYVACRDELDATEKYPEQFERFANYQIQRLLSEEGRRFLKEVRVHMYFGDIIPNLDSILEKGTMKPVEILRLYHKILRERFEEYKAPCPCQEGEF